MWLLLGLVVLASVGAAVGAWRLHGGWSGERLDDGAQLEVVRDRRSGKLEKVIVGIAVDAFVDFDAKKETWLDRWAKACGASRELQVGHAAFDRDVYLLCDDPRLRERLRAQPAFAAALHALVAATPAGFRCRRVTCRGGTLRARFTGGVDVAPLLAAAVPALKAIVAALAPAADAPAPGRDPLFARSVAVVAAAAALAVYALLQVPRELFVDDAFVLEPARLWRLGLVVGALLFCALVATTLRLLAGTSRLHRVLAEVLLVGGFGCLFGGVALVGDVNRAFDFADVQSVPATVAARHYRSQRYGRGTARSYAVTYAGAGLPDGGRVSTSEAQYHRMREDMAVRVNYREGALGLRWVQSIDPTR